MEPNLQHELPEVELEDLIVNLKKEKKFRDILKIFMNLTRIRVQSFLKAIQHAVPGDMNTSDLVSVFSSMLKNEFGISVLDSKVDQIIVIEEYLSTEKRPTQKDLKLHICYMMDLYYQLQDFDPRYLNADYREHVSKKIQKQGASTIEKNLKFMKPLIQYVSEFKKQNSFFRKLNPFRSATVSIPKSVSPILKEYVESKFNEEASNVQHENENISKMIEKTLELEEMKKSLTGAFDVVTPVFSESEMLRRKFFLRYVSLTALFMLSIGVVFIVQIFQLPQAWKVFLMFGAIPIAIFLFCMYIISNMWRLLA